MKIKFHHDNRWKMLVNISLMLLIILITLEIFFAEELHKYLSEDSVLYIDLFLTAILFFDIILWYSEAKDKYNFLKRNWVRIVAIFPFMLFFRFLHVLKIGELFAFAFSNHIIGEILVVEKLLGVEKGIHLTGKITEVTEQMVVLLRSNRAVRGLLYAIPKLPRIVLGIRALKH